MSVKWEKQEGNEGVLTVTVPAEEVNAGLDKAFKKVVKQVNVPGFRKGKMPRQMFEQRFGAEALYQDALDFILPDAYASAVEEAGINPVDRPEIDIEQMEKGKELIFTAKVTVEPEVELGDYKGLEVEKEDTEVTEEDLNKAIEADLARKAELVVKEEGEVAEGDVVNLDFDGYVNDEAFEGGKAEGYDLEIGSGQFIPGFEEQLIGTKVGDEKDVNVTFPEEYHAEELAGKEAVFKVKINEVKSKEVPELDDEMAKELDESVDSVDAYKEKYKKDLQEQKTLQAENNMKESLIAQAVENAKVDIPEAMINTELDRMMQEFEQRIAQQGLNLDLYYQFSGQTEEQLKESMKADAEARVKTNLTLAAIAKAENIEVSDADVDAELSKMSEQFGLSVDDIKAALGNGEVLKDDLRIQKAIDVLVKESKEK
ncbi:trigger factor [Macrococcoides canis]|uniref:Trigger factor n=1 Tax=Macrococcoides canis TaxID=1855823 RepID=A0AAE7C0D1_9STAP|nr:trigger factor [Macrococcus canis]MCO4095690.1 trigger factor [Macrococcus canis]QCT75106.1 trigger factor [Macrococcus canis]QIH76242.1 trigger factor [Macrococcus canis]QIH78717.1 trigger factor [Macrococcus canis]QNR08222.1 trigger factor [Macrococcus canis]